MERDRVDLVSERLLTPLMWAGLIGVALGLILRQHTAVTASLVLMGVTMVAFMAYLAAEFVRDYRRGEL